MSALVAAVRRDGAPVDRAGVEAVLESTAHRAIDGSDLWRSDAADVVLAAQRLWTTPEEVGVAQPIVRGSLRVLADARLDHRDELLSALGLEPQVRSSDHRWSDSELIARSLERWGDDAASRLLGDFAYIAWDAARRRLVAARDGLGARGLCVHVGERLILVASEIRQIIAHPEVPTRVDLGKLVDSLLDLWDDHETSLFEGVRYLPPGHALSIESGRVELRRFWRLEPDARLELGGRPATDDDAYAEAFLETATRAVRARLRSTGPIGLSLSGGLDSSTVAALAVGAGSPVGSDPVGSDPVGIDQGALRCYSYVFDQLEACDERAYIEATARLLGLRPTFLPADGLWPLRDLDGRPSVPGFLVNDPYAALALAVRDAAATDGCRVLLTGHFGDVLFLGGAYWPAELMRTGRWRDLLHRLRERWRWIAPRRDLLSHGALQLVPGARWTRWRRRLAERGSPPPIVEALGPPLRALADDGRRHRDRSWRLDSLPGRWSRRRALTAASAAQGAMAVRGEFARHGLERLDPLADRRLVELAFSLPADQLERPGETRPVMRRAMRGLLPEAVRRRLGKTTFTPLLERGMERETETLRALFRSPRVIDGPLGEALVRRAWLDEQLAGAWRCDGGYALWKVIGLELWLRGLETGWT